MNDRIAHDVRVPQLGEGLREARVVELLRAPGADLVRGDPLYVIETDKTTVELESPFDGTLIRWHVRRGDVVPIGATVALISGPGAEGIAPPSPPAAERLIPPRTRAYARERGIDEIALATIPATSHKLMPADIDAWFEMRAAASDAAGFREVPVEGSHRALVYRLRRSASLVVPGTVAIDIPWRGLDEYASAAGVTHVSPVQVFAHAVAQVSRQHAKFRSVMLGDDRMREYRHTNVGIAIARPDDALMLAVTRAAESMSLREFVAACHTQMRAALRGGDQAADDTQILITHLGKSGVVDAIPTLVAPASSVFFLGAPKADGQVRVALTFDHRLINGAGAGRFLADVAAMLKPRAQPS
jgi:pyruvate dehydrogenase E2 component (dihydrolipoamide acetyltransferase)